MKDWRIAAVIGIVGLAACGGDGPTDPGDDGVSPDQAADVAMALTVAVDHAFSLDLTAGSGNSVPSGRPPPSAEPAGTVAASGAPAATAGGPPPVAATIEWNLDDSGACPEGGSFTTVGGGTITTTEEQGQATVEWEWEADADFDGCGVEAEGAVYTFSTTSPLAVAGTGTSTTDDQGGGSGDFAWSFSGEAGWSRPDGPTETCDFDVTASLEFTSEAGGGGTWNGSISGTACGLNVERVWDTTLSGSG